MRRRGFESHPVLCSLTIRPAIRSAHDVAVACCLAMAEVRVQLPLGAFNSVRGVAWKPAGHHVLMVAGARERRFESARTDMGRV